MEFDPRLTPVTGPGGTSETGPREGAERAEGFTDVLKEALESVDALQHESEAAQAAFARGEPQDLHEVLIKVEQAEVAFKTLMEVRNKLVDAYREIMRMAG